MIPASRTILLLLAMAASPALAAGPPPVASVHGGSLIAPALRATDLDRSVAFYTNMLGMTVGTTLQHGPQTEVILTLGGRPGLILFRDAGPTPPIDHGNGFSRVVMRVADIAAVSARLAAAGYPAGEMHVGQDYKILRIKDPDGYDYELIEALEAHR